MPVTRTPAVTSNLGVGQTPQTSAVTDASSAMIPANANRAFCLMTNIGKEDVWFSVDATAELNKGTRLSRNGGVGILDSNGLSFGPINGICAIGKSSTITFQEINR